MPTSGGHPVKTVFLVAQRLERERGVQMMREPLGRPREWARDQADQTDQGGARGQGEEGVSHDRRRFVADMRTVLVGDTSDLSMAAMCVRRGRVGTGRRFRIVRAGQLFGAPESHEERRPT